MNPLLLLLLGLTVLTCGAELLVRGAAALALRLGLTPLVVGLTVVAFGTSAPELVVSLQAAHRGSGAIAVGNVLGSNLCNLALILGLCAVVRPLTASRAVIRREVPLLIAATIVAAGFLLDDVLIGWEGAVLLTGLVVYTASTLRAARRESRQTLVADPTAPAPLRLPWALALTVVGLAALIFGSDLFVEGAVRLARAWGWSETLIGLTIVAIGTSLPELAVSVTAVVKGQHDVAIGNLVGSCLFNLLGILGATGLAAGQTQAQLHGADLAVLVVVTIALLPLVRTGGKVSRMEGAGLLLAYAAYTAWLLAGGG